MRYPAVRALCVAGLLACLASGAVADSARAASGSTLDLNAYSTAEDFDMIVPHTQLAGQLDLGPSNTLQDFALAPPGFGGHVALLDGVSLEFGTGADLAGRFNSYDAAGSGDGLFLQSGATAQPYAALTDGGSFLGATVDLSDSLHVSLGEASLASGVKNFAAGPDGALARLGGITSFYDTRSAHSLLAGVSLDFAPWGGLGFTASQTTERDGVLGRFDPSMRRGRHDRARRLGAHPARRRLDDDGVLRPGDHQARPQARPRGGARRAADAQLRHRGRKARPVRQRRHGRVP